MIRYLLAAIFCLSLIVPSSRADDIESNGAADEKFNFSELLKLRDPFRKPNLKKLVGQDGLQPLERYSVSDMQLIAVMTGPKRMRALLKAPDEKSYFVSERDKVGLKGGVVTKIAHDSIVVTEELTNIIGQKEKVQTKLELSEKP